MNADPRRKAIALAMTLVLVALLATLAAGLATTTSTESVHTARRANDLQHELAVDSALRWFAREGATMTSESSQTASGDRWFSLTLGECQVRCRVARDAAKLDVTAFADEGRQRLLQRKLGDLGRRMDLPGVSVKLQPIHKTWRQSDRLPAYLGFDQLFGAGDVGAYFRDLENARAEPDRVVWSDVVTLWGDGRVDVRYAPDDVLRVLLADVDRSAAERIIEARAAGSTGLVPADLTEQVAGQVNQRLTTSSDRYALTIETAIHSDLRTWYVVTDVNRGQVRKVNFRGQVAW